MLLATFPDDVLRELLEAGKIMHLGQRQLINAPDRPPQVAFPFRGLLSIVVSLSSGMSVEAAMVGREGVVGASYVPQGASAVEHLVQVPGEALVIPNARFMALVEDHPVVAHAIVRFQEVMFQRAAQSAACGRVHSAEERLARWLLMAQDLTGESELPMTQEFLGQMMATGRPTVNMTVRALEQAGAIAHRRARIRILDRDVLTEVSCECYKSLYAFEQTALGMEREERGA